MHFINLQGCSLQVSTGSIFMSSDQIQSSSHMETFKSNEVDNRGQPEMTGTRSAIRLTALVSLFFIPGCGDDESILPPEGVVVSPQKEWTFVLYDDADFADGYDPLNDFAHLVSSSDNVNYVVLRDGVGIGACSYQISSNHEKKLLRYEGEVNMSDRKTLADFLAFAKTHFPAQRYIVAFYDHGAGWEGCCYDVTNDLTNSGDILTPEEINQAFKESGGVNIVLFTAPVLWVQ